MSKLAADGSIPPAVATTGIVIAAIANTLVKAGLAWIVGTRQLGTVVTVVLGIVALVGIGFVVLL